MHCSIANSEGMVAATPAGDETVIQADSLVRPRSSTPLMLSQLPPPCAVAPLPRAHAVICHGEGLDGDRVGKPPPRAGGPPPGSQAHRSRPQPAAGGSRNSDSAWTQTLVLLHQGQAFKFKLAAAALRRQRGCCRPAGGIRRWALTGASCSGRTSRSPPWRAAACLQRQPPACRQSAFTYR